MKQPPIFAAAVLTGVVAAACTTGSGGSASVPVGGPTAAPATLAPDVGASDTVAITTETTPDTVPPAPESTPAPDASEPGTTLAPTTTPTPTTVAPTTTAAPVFFRQGDEDPAIEIMQLKLITLDYLAEGSANGVFGPATNTALRNFQAQYGLGVDGVFGPITDRALTAAANSVNVDEG